jgi:3-methylfumaryl-CoA hydratase
LDREDPEPAEGDILPPLWHWLYCMPIYRRSETGEDGHPRRGGFLPPVPHPQRLWAGGRIEFLEPIRIGEALVRNSVVSEVEQRRGKSGPLVFVRVNHEYSVDGRMAVRETHDIVYRNRQESVEAPSGAQKTLETADWTMPFSPDPVTLFRYSALTFNSFRPHYDRPYAEDVEHYPGLTVHAPLVATLLMELVRKQETAQARSIAFRATAPLFDVLPFTVNGRRAGDSRIELWAARQDGTRAMEADLETARGND